MEHIPFWMLWPAWEAESTKAYSMENCGLLSCSSLPALGTGKDRQMCPGMKGTGCNSAWLSRGNASSFSKYIRAWFLYWLHGQWQCSTITTEIIIHNLFQIHQKCLYFFFRSTGSGTRNRITDLPLNSKALLIQNPPHVYTVLCNWLWCTAKFTKH